MPANQPARNDDALVARFAELCATDERIVAGFLGGSRPRGDADAFSDVDLCLIATDEAFDEVTADGARIVDQLGERLFLEDFGSSGFIYFILADGTEGEIFFIREGALHEIQADAIHVLFDPGGILDGVTFTAPPPDPVEQEEHLRQILNWFWHDCSHLIAALGRNQLWWAAGQLEALRRYCVNLVRIEQGVEARDEAYDKLDKEVSTNALAVLEPTFVPMDHAALLAAADTIVTFFRERAPIVAAAHGATYPVDLERLMRRRLDELKSSGAGGTREGSPVHPKGDPLVPRNR